MNKYAGVQMQKPAAIALVFTSDDYFPASGRETPWVNVGI
jgi:hypothetical protein